MCPSEVSDIEHSIWQEYQDQGVIVWGIASGETQSALEDFRDQMGISYPILMDTDGAVNQEYAQYFAFASAAYPQDWVIGTDGVVIYRNNGFELDAMITAIESQL